MIEMVLPIYFKKTKGHSKGQPASCFVYFSAAELLFCEFIKSLRLRSCCEVCL